MWPAVGNIWTASRASLISQIGTIGTNFVAIM
jgi:hypothetical protein